MGCNCGSKNKVIYRGPESITADSFRPSTPDTPSTGGQAPVQQAVTADGRPQTSSQ